MKRLYTAIITPFNEKKEIDFTEFGKIVELVKNENSDGIVIASLVGEGSSLSLDEKILLLQTALPYKDDKFEIILSLIENNTESILDSLATLNDYFFDAYLLPLPFFLQPSQEGILTHFREIAARSNKKILVHISPARGGCSITFETLLSLFSIENIIGIVSDSNDIDIIKAIKTAKPEFLYLVGNERYLLPSLKKGADGVVSISSHLISKDIKEMLNNYESDIENLGLVEFINLISDLVTLDTIPSAIKYILKQHGLNSMELRLPLLPLATEYKKKIDVILE